MTDPDDRSGTRINDGRGSSKPPTSGRSSGGGLLLALCSEVLDMASTKVQHLKEKFFPPYKPRRRSRGDFGLPSLTSTKGSDLQHPGCQSDDCACDDCRSLHASQASVVGPPKRLFHNAIPQVPRDSDSSARKDSEFEGLGSTTPAETLGPTATVTRTCRPAQSTAWPTANHTTTRAKASRASAPVQPDQKGY